MTGIEIFIVILLVASLAWGYKRGIVVQLGSLLSFVVAIAACRIMGDAASNAIFSMMDGEDPSQSSMNMLMARCMGHIFVFLAAWLAVWLIARTIKFFAKAVHMGFIDSLGGALFMVFKTGMVISFIISFAKVLAPGCGLATGDGPVLKALSGFAPLILGFVQQSAT